MNAQLKGIAVILFGILLTILGSSVVLSVGEVSLLGAVVGLIGVIVVVVNGDDGVEHVGDVQGAVLEAVTNEDAAVPCTSHKGAFGV